MRPGGRRVNFSSMGSFGRALSMVGFIRVRWVNSVAPWRSSCEFGFIGSILARPWRGRIHCRWFSLLMRVLAVVELSCALSGWLDSFLCIGFMRARSERGRFHSVSLCSFGRALGIVVFIRWVDSGAHWSSSGSLGSFGLALGVNSSTPRAS